MAGGKEALNEEYRDTQILQQAFVHSLRSICLTDESGAVESAHFHHTGLIVLVVFVRALLVFPAVTESHQ